MNLGNIENVELTPSTKTTLLMERIDFGSKSTNTLCVDSNILVRYNASIEHPLGEKTYRVCLYLTNWGLAMQLPNHAHLDMTFTDIKKYWTNRYDIDINKDYEHLLLKNICLAIRANLEMAVDSVVDYFFDQALSFRAQGNWDNRGWGHSVDQHIVGVKICRCR